MDSAMLNLFQQFKKLILVFLFLDKRLKSAV